MHTLLLIRNADDVPAAVDAASELRALQRRRSAERDRVDEVLGVWIRAELDVGLPVWLGPEGGESELGVRHSLSLGGRWSLCAVDGPLLRAVSGGEARRQVIVDSLVAGVAQAPAAAFFPVFAAGHPTASAMAAVRGLQRRHPGVVGKAWFVEEQDGRIVPARGAAR